MRKEVIPKILAIYLPQFYENEDNNRWWGKGFTDWKTVKTAEAYFEGHKEPKIPLDEEYYDLSTKETMRKQAERAKKYGIGGFCFYHYYFKDGKKELELPAENLLRWKDIDMPFCFNWASEPWIRSWSRISGNVWTEKYENAEEKGQGGVLTEQAYGTQTDWIKHFEYLLPFFRDKRYIKLDGKPVFIFYSPNNIRPLKEMVACWRSLALESGLPGLYFIGAHLEVPSSCLDAALVYEPRNSINVLNHEGRVELKNGIRCFDYQNIWETLLRSSPVFGYKTYFCGVSGYDDTPRRGKSGEVLIRNTPEIFEKNLKRLLEKSINYGNEYLFLNAWNEWGEGMYLEPDEENEYKYLEAVKSAVDSICGVQELPNDVVEYSVVVQKEISQLSYNVHKFKGLFEIIDKWLFLEQEGKVDFSAFFERECVSSVAIYGMAALGKHLFVQLRKEGKEVSFGIDRYVGQYGSDFRIYRPEDDFPASDAIIVTSYDVEAIIETLRSKYYGKVYSLEEILERMADEYGRINKF